METSIYQTVVANARLLARETLRTRNIHKWIRENADLSLAKTKNNKAIDQQKEAITEAELQVKRVEYKLSQLDEANPDYTQLKEVLDNSLASAKAAIEKQEKYLALLTEDVASLNAALDKQIAENMAKIGRWESGENKVQLENINELARQYVEVFQTEKAKSLDTLVFEKKAKKA